MSNKVKILCLHGYRQNATAFKSKTGSFQKILKSEAQFYFLSAPHKIPGIESYEGEEQDQRAWWFTRNGSFSSRDETDQDTGLRESLRAIEAFWKEHGPFDGILGFSQGAALVGLLCAFKETKEIALDFRFVIIFSGFKSRCSLHEKYYKQKIPIKSLHVIGESDQVITPEMSHALAEMFIDPVVLLHPGGHFVPGKSVWKQNYLDFLSAQKTN